MFGRCKTVLQSDKLKFENGKSYCLVVHNIEYGKYILKDFVGGKLGSELIIEPENNIGIDEIRQAIEFLEFKSDEEKKLVVIYEADKMTQEAANAFLKTLEEPPSYGVIVLVTSRYASLLPTIKSRVQKINVGFPELPDDLSDFEKHLVFWNYSYLERILNHDYTILSEEELQDEEVDELNVIFTLKELLNKYKEASFQDYLKFISKISKISNFRFLKILSKVVAWYVFQSKNLSQDEKYRYIKICDDIQKSKLANFNYQLTYYTLLLGLRGDNA